MCCVLCVVYGIACALFDDVLLVVQCLPFVGWLFVVAHVLFDELWLVLVVVCCLQFSVCWLLVVVR